MWSNGLVKTAPHTQASLPQCSFQLCVNPNPRTAYKYKNKQSRGGEGPLRYAGWVRVCAEPINGRSAMWPDLLSVFQQLLTHIAVFPHISLGQMAALAPLPRPFLKAEGTS